MDSHTQLEVLYSHYIQNRGPDGEEVRECYEELNRLLAELPWKKSNEIECAVNAVCAVTERIAFADGIRTGGKLMLELTK